MEYLTFVMYVGDDLEIFLAQFRWLWERAYPFGVTHYDGIVRLIMLLPSDWQGWAIDRSRDYVFSVAPYFDIMGDFPMFLAEIHSCFILNGQAPLGPYILPGDLVPVMATVDPESFYPQDGTIAPPSSPVAFGRGRFEAGPSRPLLGEEGTSRLRAHPAPSPPGGDASDPEARELRVAAAERRRRGKAPISSDEDEEQVTPVGTIRLQPISISPETHVDALLAEGTHGPHIPGSSFATAMAIEDSSEEEASEEDPDEDPEYEATASTTSSST